MKSADRNKLIGSVCFYFGLHMVLLLGSVFILKELALAGFFNEWVGKATTILLVIGIIGYRCYISLLRKKNSFSNMSSLKEEFNDQEQSHRRDYIVIIALILLACFLGLALYTFIWIMNYGIENQIMTSYSEGIFLSICSLAVYTLIRMTVNGIRNRLCRKNLCCERII